MNHPECCEIYWTKLKPTDVQNKKNRSHAKRLSEKLSAGDGGDVDLDNFDSDMLFDEDLKKLVEKNLKVVKTLLIQSYRNIFSMNVY